MRTISQKLVESALLPLKSLAHARPSRRLHMASPSIALHTGDLDVYLFTYSETSTENRVVRMRGEMPWKGRTRLELSSRTHQKVKVPFPSNANNVEVGGSFISLQSFIIDRSGRDSGTSQKLVTTPPPNLRTGHMQ